MYRLIELRVLKTYGLQLCLIRIYLGLVENRKKLLVLYTSVVLSIFSKLI